MVFIDKLTGIALSLWNNLKALLGGLIKLFLDFIFRLVDLFLPLQRLALFVRRMAPGFWNWIINLGFIKRMLSRNVFRKFGNAAPARPHAFTMAADYTSWESLIDRSYTGRHLPHGDKNRVLPAPDDVIDLFMRGKSANEPGVQTDCIRSTVMFASFAQWFTDSFLRTAHHFKFDADGNVLRDASGAPLREPDRERFNTSNHEIDLCQIYGLNEKQTDILRLNSANDRGCLRYQETEDGEFPPFLLDPPVTPAAPLPIKQDFKDLHPDERILRSIFLRADRNANGYETIFATGLEHSNATIGNALLNTVFLREHNRVARLIAADNQTWDDEQVFQTARNVMIVLLLKIVISDYIRHISPLNLPIEFQPGFAETQSWYRTNRISIEFNLLYRWHGLVPNEFSFMPIPQNPNAFRHNNDWLMQTGIGKAVDHFSKERAGRITIGNTPWYLRGVKADTISLMRGANLASYNDYRERFGMRRATSFDDISTDNDLTNKLREFYNDDIDALEWCVGMFAEDHKYDMIMGDLLLNMVGHDAFSQALTNPLLGQQVFNEETFSAAGWQVINETSTLNAIVQRVKKDSDDVLCSFSSVG